MRKALIALGVVIVVLVGADFGLRALAQFWVAGQLQSSFGLEERPSVSLGGVPFIPRLITGRFPTVTVESTGTVKGSDFPMAAVDLTLRDVRFPADQLVFGNKATVRAKGGSGTATLSEQDINQAFPATIPITVRLVDGGVRIRANGLAVDVPARLKVANNRLVLGPVAGTLPVEVGVRLPVLVEGLTYTGVKVEDSKAFVTFTLLSPTIRVA
jgi:DUF2993 family protein